MKLVVISVRHAMHITSTNGAVIVLLCLPQACTGIVANLVTVMTSSFPPDIAILPLKPFLPFPSWLSSPCHPRMALCALASPRRRPPALARLFLTTPDSPPASRRFRHRPRCPTSPCFGIRLLTFVACWRAFSILSVCQAEDAVCRIPLMKDVDWPNPGHKEQSRFAFLFSFGRLACLGTQYMSSASRRQGVVGSGLTARGS